MYREVREVKSTLLLALTLFLVSAPAPDSNDIAEMTSNFIVPQGNPGLQAGEESARPETTELSAAKTRTIRKDDLKMEKPVKKNDQANNG
jgi:hypothetical protein